MARMEQTSALPGTRAKGCRRECSAERTLPLKSRCCLKKPMLETHHSPTQSEGLM